MLILGLIALLLSGIVIISFCRRQWLQIVLSIVWTLLFCLQLSSVYFGDSFIDYRYFRHLNKETFSMFEAFKWEAALCLILVVVLPFLLIYCGKLTNLLLNRLQRPAAVSIKIAVLLAAISLMVFPKESMCRKLSEVSAIIFNSDSDNKWAAILTSKEALQATASAGKNIVIISIESFEKAFLLPPNQYLTPNFQQRMEKWKMYDMTLTNGAGWTAGSLYAVFTGLPAFFAGHGNNFFKETSGYKPASLAHILNHCGYETYHLSNNARFAGTETLLHSLGIKNVEDWYSWKKYPLNPIGGAYDMDIFTEAKKIAHRKRNNPFMMFIATTQTHRPNGVVDERMYEHIEPQETTLETAAISTDWLIEDFLNDLENNGLLDNTIVYIFPDHDFWGEKPILDRAGNRRQLWMMTNADNLQIKGGGEFYQIDLPKVILQGAEVEHNAMFFTDLIKDCDDKNEFINTHLKEIATLNASILERKNTLRNNLSVKKEKGLFEYITCEIDGKTIIKKRCSALKDKHIVIPLDVTLKYLKPMVYTGKELEADFFEPCDTYIDIQYQENDITLKWVRDNKLTYTISNEEEISLDSEMVYNIIDKISAKDGHINTLYKNYVMNHLTEDKNLFSGSVLDYLPEVMNDSNKLLIISAHDSANGHFDKIRPMLHGFGLKEDLSDKFRYAYVAVLSPDTIYFEKAAHAPLHRKISIDDCAISVTSCGFDHISKETGGNILIDNVEYCPLRLGLNFVIYDRKSKRVTDAFNVNTYEDESLTINR